MIEQITHSFYTELFQSSFLGWYETGIVGDEGVEGKRHEVIVA
jgi:hypothetical protein